MTFIGITFFLHMNGITNMLIMSYYKMNKTKYYQYAYNVLL